MVEENSGATGDYQDELNNEDEDYQAVEACEENDPNDGDDGENAEYEEAEEGGDGDEEAFPECDDKVTSQQEEEQTKVFNIDELLTRKITFKNEEEGFVFSRGPKYSDDKWPVNCHVCRLGNLVTKEQIQGHVNSRRHIIKLKRKWQSLEQYHIPFLQCADKTRGLDKPIKIYPGEVIGELTDDMTGRIVKQEEFAVKPPDESHLKELSNEPMHEYNKKLPLIGLCYMYKMKGKNGASYYCTLCTMKIQLASGFKHVTSPNHQYKYIIRHFPKLYEKVVAVLQKEQSIDFKMCVRNIFRKLYRKIENARGFREITLVDDGDFYKNKRRYMLKTRFDDHYDENTILITQQEVDVLIRKCINRMEFIKPDPKDIGKPVKPQREDRGRPLKRLPPRYYSRDMGGYDDDAAWERYHYIIEREIDDLNRDYQEYDRNPKNHPLYFSVQQMYFKSAGKDQRKLRNLRRDWMPFWRSRLLQLYENDLAKRKLRVKRELRLRTDIRTPSPMDSTRQGVPTRRTPSPPGYDRRYADRQYSRDNVVQLPPSEPLGVISVLRLLTALEDQLGSLGPKAVQLMSKAVLAEKSNQNPNDLMMESEIYVFFVTAKEKLKGQLYANIVEQNKIGAVNRAVADATTLLEMFEDYMRRTGKRPVASSSTSAKKSV